MGFEAECRPVVTSSSPPSTWVCPSFPRVDVNVFHLKPRCVHDFHTTFPVPPTSCPTVSCARLPCVRSGLRRDSRGAGCPVMEPASPQLSTHLCVLPHCHAQVSSHVGETRNMSLILHKCWSFLSICHILGPPCFSVRNREMGLFFSEPRGSEPPGGASGLGLSAQGPGKTHICLFESSIQDVSVDL